MLTRNYLQFFNVFKTLQKLQYRSHSIKNVTPVFKKASEHSEKIALRDEFGKYTYKDLLKASAELASEISQKLDGKVQERVALLCSNNASYVIAQWACWMSGQISVPLCPSHPEQVLRHYVSDSQTSLIIADPQYESSLENLCSSRTCSPFILDPALRISALYKSEDKTDKDENEIDLSSLGKHSDFYSTNDAMIIYTSGSTGVPKGVVLSHLNIEAQIKSMIEAWAWEEKDCILHTLPLYHIHGIVNALLVPLYVGAKCVMLREFDTSQVWSELVGVKTASLDRVTLFTGVPTMYSKLIQEFDTKLNNSDRISEYVKQTCSQKIRLMLCGSAPLNKNIFDRWHEITGHKLVERYGMTETGMILSSSLSEDRTYGSVGVPMPGVQVRIVIDERDGSKRVIARGTRAGTDIQMGNKYIDSTSNQVSYRSVISDPSSKNQSITGVLHVSGDTVASRYWNRPQATASDFKSGWFNTGDIVEYSDGKYSLLGRVSSDIIKTGGFKVSALQVETVLMEYEPIADVAVVPLDDPIWGEKIGLLVVVKEGMSLELNKLKSWASDRLPDYAMPRIIVEADGVIPRNHMGKVNRSQLKDMFFVQPPQHASASA